MKGLHKKISVGVLVSGLLIGGVNFPSGSVAHASSKSNKSSLFVDLKGALSELKLKVPDILEIFLEYGFRGILEDDYNKSKLPNILNRIEDGSKRDDYRSVVSWGKSGKYAVLGFKLDNQKHVINADYNKYWVNSELRKISYNDFSKAARNRFDKGFDEFEKLRLKIGYIYKVIIDEKNEFLIAVFDKDGM